MDARLAEHYRSLYHTHWWWRAREVLLLRHLQQLAEGRSRVRFLDVGCGDGLFFGPLSELGEVEGIEPDRSLLSDKSIDDARIHIARFSESFVVPHKFDFVLMLDVLEHLEDPVAALRHARALLKADGHVVITVPAFPILWTSHDDLNHHFVRFTRTSLGTVASDAGLDVDLIRYFFHWTVLPKLLLRAVEAIIGPRESERIPAPSVNRLLYLLSRLEQELPGTKHLPFGSSLLAICRRG